MKTLTQLKEKLMRLLAVALFSESKRNFLRWKNFIA